MFELPAPFHTRAGGKGNLPRDLVLGLAHDRKEIASAHVELHREAAGLVLAADLYGTGGEMKVGDVAQGNELTGERFHGQRCQGIELTVEAMARLDHDPEAPLPFEHVA